MERSEAGGVRNRPPHPHLCYWCEVVVAEACSCKHPRTIRMCEACSVILKVQLLRSEGDS
jgi:hypothetical protein